MTLEFEIEFEIEVEKFLDSARNESLLFAVVSR